MPGVTTVRVTRAEEGQKLVAFLRRRVGRDLPQSALLRWIRTGQVRVDGGRKKPFDRLRRDQMVRIPPHDPPQTSPAKGETPPAPGAPDLGIVHEDRDLLVLHKPAGLPAHGGTGHTDSVAARLAARHAHAPFTPTLAHRLDRDTSGLLLAAKSYAMLQQLQSAIQDGALEKTYLAWAWGDWPMQGETTLRDRVEKAGPQGRERMQTGQGKTALARVRPLRQNTLGRGQNPVTLLAVTLLTGRTHQIRIQLASRGHALVGDRKYGPQHQTTPRNTGLLLHACRLRLLDREWLLLPDWSAPLNISERILHML